MAGLVEVLSFCHLIPSDNTHSVIELTDAEPMVIGRNLSTKITDRKCSRQQVEVCADFTNSEVHIKHLGFHPSRAANKVLRKGDTYILGPMGWLELLEGDHRYHVHFGKKVSGVRSSEVDFPGDSANNTKEDEEKNPESENQPPQKKVKIDQEDSKSIQQTLHSFVEGPGSSSSLPKLDLTPTWRENGTLLIMQYGPAVNSAKVASFDLDNTIIETSSGKKFATESSDWKLMKGVMKKLVSLSKEGYKVVFLTNQLGISKGKPTKTDFKQKIDSIAKQLQIPLLVMASTMKDMYRKPCIGMWKHLVEHENGEVVLDMKSCFYVGDAAGREKDWMPGKKKDFSCTDRKFAYNVNIQFFTPEENFLGYRPCKRFSWGDFNPTALDYSKPMQPFTAPSYKQEMIVFVGYPAAGKTSFFRTYLEPKHYCHVNRDTLGSWQKCVTKCNQHLQAGKHVVVDNTNPDKESRKRYIDVARQFKVPVRCFQFMTSIGHAKHNNKFRQLTAKDDPKSGKVNDMVFNIYKSKFVEPTCDEGFSDVTKIEFCPQFTDNSLSTLYSQFLD